MKRYLTPTFTLVIVLLIIVLLQRECSRPDGTPAKQDTVYLKADTVVNTDTIFKTKTLPAPDPVHEIDCVFVTSDTAGILREYNRLRIYQRLLVCDSFADITIYDTVFKNKLQGYRLNTKFYKRDTTIYITKFINTLPDPPRSKVFAGFLTGMILPDKIYISPTVLLVTKSDHLYQVGYDPFNRVATVGMAWKIRLSRRPP